MRVVATAVPVLATGTRLRFDRTRQQWVLLAPERVFVLDPISREVLQECDGASSVIQIVQRLARRYEALADEILSVNQILSDVLALLEELSLKKVLST
jgi:pyrroloquinoline quinone biosynthesis protein D